MVLYFKISLQIKHTWCAWHMVGSQQMSQTAGEGGKVEEERGDQTIQCSLALGSRTYLVRRWIVNVHIHITPFLPSFSINPLSILISPFLCH